MALLITDLTCALPTNAWTDADSTVFKPVADVPHNTWRVIDYETDKYSGRLLHTSNPESAELTIPLNTSGWHAVSIGVAGIGGGLKAVEVRLTGTKHWQPLWARYNFTEVPWIFADLTGKNLEIRCPRSKLPLPAPASDSPADADVSATVFSIRADPVRPEHVRLLEQDAHMPLVYINDGHGIFYHAREPGAHIITDNLGMFADGDWDICCFGCGSADRVNYPSKVGRLMAVGGWDYPRTGDANMARIITETIAQGVDPLKLAVDTAHAQDQRFWGYLRPQSWTLHPPLDHAFRSEFFQDHPEYLCLGPEGVTMCQMSITFPEVRQRLNSIVQEALDRGADGTCVVFIRGFPVVRYEQPVVDRYRELHGGDARKLPDSDKSLRQVWAWFVETWIRELREMLDQAGPSAMRERRELALMTGPDLEWNLKYGIDVEILAKKGLIDVVMPYQRRDQNAWQIDVQGYKQALNGTEALLLPSLGTHRHHFKPLQRYRKRADTFYREGVDGLCLWDTDGYLARVGLDDPEAQKLWCDFYMPYEKLKILSVGGMNIGRFPTTGF